MHGVKSCQMVHAAGHDASYWTGCHCYARSRTDTSLIMGPACMMHLLTYLAAWRAHMTGRGSAQVPAATMHHYLGDVDDLPGGCEPLQEGNDYWLPVLPLEGQSADLRVQTREAYLMHPFACVPTAMMVDGSSRFVPYSICGVCAQHWCCCQGRACRCCVTGVEKQ